MDRADRAIPTADPMNALRHPAWWTALAVLVLNDHVLKRAGVLPGWLTGKLSDVAGLIVAPVLLAAVAGARSPRARALCFALVAGAFAAIKSLPAASHFYEVLLGLAGFPSRNACDPGDLFALLALPLAWKLAHGVPAPRERRRVVERVGLVLAGLACVATSGVDPEPRTWSTDAYVFNDSNAAIDLRVRWAAAALDCERVARDPRAALRREHFTAQPVTFTVNPGTTVPLERFAAMSIGMTGLTREGTARSCDAVLLQAENLPTVAVFWRGGTLQTVATRVTTLPSNARLAVVLDDAAGGGLRATTLDGATAFAPEAEARPCATPGARFQAGGEPGAWGTTITLRAVTRLPDGCTRLEGTDPQGAARSLYVCVPPEALPFAAGATVRTEQAFRDGGYAFSLAGTRATLTVVSNMPWPAARELAGLTLSFAPEAACAGHTTCGAFVERHAMTVAGRGVGGPLAPGGSARIDNATAFLGRAERVVVAPDDCNTEYPATGPVVDLAILTGE